MRNLRLSRMDFTQLKTLIHVAELGSLTKAADRLRIAQPALSRQIRLLESELGTSLFDRHGRGMSLTAAGADVLDHATLILSELDAIRNSATGKHSSFRGLVSVGMTPTVAEIATVPLMKRIKNEHPQLSVRFSSAFSGYLLDWLQRGELDLAVSYDPQPLRSLRIIPIMIESLMLVGPKDKRLSRKRAIQFSELAGMDLVLPSPRHGLRTIVDECAYRAKIKLRASVEADSFGAMIDLVQNGFGSTILPLAPIYNRVKNGDFHAVPLVNPKPTRKLVVVYPADRPISPAARFVGEAFINVSTELVKRNFWVGQILPQASGARSSQ